MSCFVFHGILCQSRDLRAPCVLLELWLRFTAVQQQPGEPSWPADQRIGFKDLKRFSSHLVVRRTRKLWGLSCSGSCLFCFFCSFFFFLLPSAFQVHGVFSMQSAVSAWLNDVNVGEKKQLGMTVRNSKQLHKFTNVHTVSSFPKKCRGWQQKRYPLTKDVLRFYRRDPAGESGTKYLYQQWPLSKKLWANWPRKWKRWRQMYLGSCVRLLKFVCTFLAAQQNFQESFSLSRN